MGRYRCGGSQGLQIRKDSVRKEMKNLRPGHCQFWVSNAVTTLGSKPKCSFRPGYAARHGTHTGLLRPNRGCWGHRLKQAPPDAEEALSSRVNGGEIGELGPFLLKRVAAPLTGSCPPVGQVGLGPPVLGKRPEDSGSAPTARGWPPPQQSACPAAQTASLPLNLSPRRRPTQEARWHVNIMKLKTSATQSYISFHVLNI